MRYTTMDAAKVKELRKAQGLKQADLAKMIGISSSLMSRYEHGEMEPPRDRLEAIAEALGVDAEEIETEHAFQNNFDDAFCNESTDALSLEEPFMHPYLNSNRFSPFRAFTVRQEVRMYAEGKCEVCGSPAPFRDEAGDPYLKMFLVVSLNDGGEITPTNAVALCPNCHCRLSITPSSKYVKDLSEIAARHTWKNYLDLVNLIKAKD